MPTGSQSQGRLLPVAAFAVCLNMPGSSYESKLSTNFQAYLNAWTHCFAQKKASAVCRCFLHVRDKIRTRDLLVRSQTLYPAELPTHFAALSATNSIVQQLDNFVNILFKISVFSEGISTDVLWNSPTNLSELP